MLPDVVDNGTAGALGRGGNAGIATGAVGVGDGIGAGDGSVYLVGGAYGAAVGKLGSSRLLFFFLLNLSNIPIK